MAPSGTKTTAATKKAATKKEPLHDEKYIATKIERSLQTRAKYLAAERGESVHEFLSDLIREPLEREWVKSRPKAGDKT
jgi:hypothetical protein